MIHEVDITFGDWPVWFVLAVSAVVLFAVAMFYRRVARTLGRRYLVLLTGLRLAAMIALLLCLFRPELTVQRRKATKDLVYVLVDASKSMSLRDYAKQREDRFGRAVSLLLETGGAAERLAETFDVRYYTFDSHPAAVERVTGLPQIKPEGPATDLANSVTLALGNTSAEKIAAVILLTDGIHNSVADPVAPLTDLGVRIFPVGVGSHLSEQTNYKNIAVQHVEHSRTVPLETSGEITCFLRSAGFADRVVTLDLEEVWRDEKTDRIVRRERVTSAEVVLQSGAEQRVVLRYPAKVRGEHELVASIKWTPDERIREDNQSTFHIYVTEPLIKVLYVEGHVRPEFGAVKRALDYDPNIQMIALARIVGSRFNQFGRIEGVTLDGFPRTLEQLRPFRVIILGNIEASTFSAEQLKNIATLVREEGAGFMMVGGKHSYGPGAYAGTPIEDLLPVYCGGRNAGQEEAPFDLTLTPAGLSHPVFAGCQRFFRAENRVPGVPKLLGCSRVPGPKPGATVLAVNPNRRTEQGPLVAVAVGRYGNGRTLASTFDTTYLWDIPMRGLGRESPFVKYWGQSVRWLAGREKMGKDVQPLVAYPDRYFYPVGAEPRILARVADEQGQATNLARVTAVLTRVRDGQESRRQLPYIPGTRGEYEQKLSPLEPGRYRVTVSATLDEKPVGEESFAFRVGEPDKEFERLDLNDALLKEIARRTGGRYHTPLSFDQLVDSLNEEVERTLVTRVVRMWNSPLLFLAVVLLVTSEWILRRRRYLV